MVEYGLEPAFIKLDYVSAFGAHSHLICTTAFNPVGIGGVLGSYVSWLGVPVDGEEMVDTMVDVMKLQHMSSTTINLATIFTKANETSPSVPRASKTYAVVGTQATAQISRAVQKTFNFRSTGIHAAKLVFLDVPHGNTDFNKEFPSAWTTNDDLLFDTFSGGAWAWAARDNTQIINGVSITWNLNQELRKQYGMA